MEHNSRVLSKTTVIWYFCHSFWYILAVLGCVVLAHFKTFEKMLNLINCNELVLKKKLQKIPLFYDKPTAVQLKLREVLRIIYDRNTPYSLDFRYLRFSINIDDIGSQSLACSKKPFIYR